MRTWVAPLVAVALAGVAFGQDDEAKQAEQAEKAWKAAHEQYLDYTTWEALGARSRGAQRLAKTLDPRAVALICARYRKPGETHPREEQLLVAGFLQLFATSVHGAQAVSELAEADGCAWLDYSAACLRAGQGGHAELAAVACDLREDPIQRSVALQALGAHGPAAEVAALLAGLLGESKLVKKRGDEPLVLAACCEAVLALGRRSERAVWRDAALALAARLGKRTPKPEAGTIARFLGTLLEVKERYLEPGPWEALIRAEALAEGEAGTRTRTQFMGLSTTGERVVYVIDLSDSMLLPLSEEERDVLRPLTSTARKKNAVDWDHQRTRFDAVRECLKLSLRSLDKRTQFAVVRFGNDAKALDATPRLIPASKRNVALVCHELDLLTADSSATSPRLYGRTNVHAGVRLAFQLTARGPVPSGVEHQHPEALNSGCDAIFLLSDGTPTRWDYQGSGPEKEYPAYDIPERDYEVKDPETGKVRQVHQEARHVPARTAKQSMAGPFSDPTVFSMDLRRLNLLRKVEVNAIGVGEYSKAWLQRITAGGQGQLRLIGDGEPEPKQE